MSINIFITNAGKGLSVFIHFLFFGRQKVEVEIMFFENTLRDLVLSTGANHITKHLHYRPIDVYLYKCVKYELLSTNCRTHQHFLSKINVSIASNQSYMPSSIFPYWNTRLHASDINNAYKFISQINTNHPGNCFIKQTGSDVIKWINRNETK
jgi:hypothetical protein